MQSCAHALVAMSSGMRLGAAVWLLGSTVPEDKLSSKAVSVPLFVSEAHVRQHAGPSAAYIGMSEQLLQQSHRQTCQNTTPYTPSLR